MKRLHYPVRLKVKSAVTADFLLVEPDGDLAVSVESLSTEMARQPAKYAFYAALAEEEYRRGKRLRYKLHCTEEDLDAKIRKEAASASRKPTEKEIATRVRRHPKMRALYELYVKTMRRAGHLRVLKDAFEQRANMLQSIGAMQRREAEVELRTLKRRAEQKQSNQ